MLVAKVVYREICSKSYHDLDLDQKKVALLPDRWCSTKMAAIFASRDNVDLFFIHITAYHSYSWKAINESGILTYIGKTNFNI